MSLVRSSTLMGLLSLAALAVAQNQPPKLPSPALVVLNKAENTLIVVDPGTLKVVGAPVPTGEGPHELAVWPDRKLAVVCNYGAQTPGSTLSVIDLAAQKELRRVDLGALRRPHGIWQNGGKFWYTVEANKAVGRYDAESDKLDWLMGTGQNATHMVAVTHDQRKVFTANIGSDSITLLEQAGPQGWQATQIAVGRGPEAIDISPDESEVWTAHSRDGGVSIIDVATKKVKKTLPAMTKRSNRLKFTPDGKRVLISDLEGGELVVLDAASHQELKRVKMGRAPEGIVIPPDGGRAFVAVAGEDHVAVVDLKTLEITGRISTGKGPDGLAWLP